MGGHLILSYSITNMKIGRSPNSTLQKKNSKFKIYFYFLTLTLMRIRWPHNSLLPKEKTPFFRKRTNRWPSNNEKSNSNEKKNQPFDFFFLEEGKIRRPHNVFYYNGLLKVKLHWDDFILLELSKEEKSTFHYILDIEYNVVTKSKKIVLI